MDRVIICTVVTEKVFDEFMLMRRSFELFHGSGFDWHIRCDSLSHRRLADLPQCTATIFAESVPSYSSQWSTEFRSIVEQKMFVIEDAWSLQNVKAVLFVDSDIVFTSNVMAELDVAAGDLVLTPHYYSIDADHKNARFGLYNSGFLYVRDSSFSKWWLQTFRQYPNNFTDQWSLNLLPPKFVVNTTGPEWNFGYWRRRGGWELPSFHGGIRFYHGHLFVEPHLENSYECGQKDFALEFLYFLSTSEDECLKRLLTIILEMSSTSYYARALRGEFQVVTQCDVSRARRIVMLAKSVPTSVGVVCAITGTQNDFVAQLDGAEFPVNLKLIESSPSEVHPTNKLRNLAFANSYARWLAFVDSDFVFQRGFWYLLFTRYEELLLDGACIVPAPVWSKNARFFSGRPESWEDSEVMTNHHPPEGWDVLGRPELFRFHDRWLPRDEVGPGYECRDITSTLRIHRFSMHPAEPWGVLRRDKYAWADEDFCGRTMDKQQFVSALIDRGVKFVYSPELFIFHNHHPETTGPAYRPERGKNRSAWIRRYVDKQAKFVLMGIDPNRNALVELAIKRAIESIFGPDQMIWNPLDTEGVSAGVVEDACFSGYRLINAGTMFDPRILGYGYRLITTIVDPRTYWLELAARLSARDGLMTVSEQLRHMEMTGIIADGRLVAHLSGPASISSLDAAWNLQHFAAVLDGGNDIRTSEVLSNILGENVSVSFPLGTTGARLLFDYGNQIANLIPRDMELYRFAISHIDRA